MSEPKSLDFTTDPYWGKGGRYVVDPVTGLRTPAPVETETAAAPAVAADPAPAAGADAAAADAAAGEDTQSTTVKGKKHV